MKRSGCIALTVAALSCVGLSGCVAFSQEHPVSESRYITPQVQAYWLDRRWRQDIADHWASELERQSATRMAREFGN
jgi:hypothetical protein